MSNSTIAKTSSGFALLSDKEFSILAEYIYEKVGIKMPPAKKTMLESRLHKRLRILGLPTFGKYLEYLFTGEGMHSEPVYLIDAVTTNKTDFFREPAHFDFLVKIAIPQMISSGLFNQGRMRIWSAGCSTGKEPYTMSMVLSEIDRLLADTRWEIFASDISTRVLDAAKTAVYPLEEADEIPAEYRKKYLLKSKNKELFRIVPELRSKISFKRINLMDDSFGISEKMDVIFCRNVMIYFDKKTQETLVNKFSRQLKRGGYLFIGHSETLNGLNVDFKPVASTVYRKP